MIVITTSMTMRKPADALPLFGTLLVAVPKKTVVASDERRQQRRTLRIRRALCHAQFLCLSDYQVP
jgi:hypothetical protein